MLRSAPHMRIAHASALISWCTLLLSAMCRAMMLQVAQAKAPSCGPSFVNRNRRRAGVSSDVAAFAVGLLDIAIPRDDRPGGSFPRVMINEACIAQAVQGRTSNFGHTIDSYHDVIRYQIPGTRYLMPGI